MANGSETRRIRRSEREQAPDFMPEWMEDAIKEAIGEEMTELPEGMAKELERVAAELAFKKKVVGVVRQAEEYAREKVDEYMEHKGIANAELRATRWAALQAARERYQELHGQDLPKEMEAAELDKVRQDLEQRLQDESRESEYYEIFRKAYFEKYAEVLDAIRGYLHREMRKQKWEELGELEQAEG